jgi:hypothetical protein
MKIKLFHHGRSGMMGHCVWNYVLRFLGPLPRDPKNNKFRFRLAQLFYAATSHYGLLLG